MVVTDDDANAATSANVVADVAVCPCKMFIMACCCCCCYSTHKYVCCCCRCSCRDRGLLCCCVWPEFGPSRVDVFVSPSRRQFPKTAKFQWRYRRRVNDERASKREKTESKIPQNMLFVVNTILRAKAFSKESAIGSNLCRLINQSWNIKRI